MPHAFTPLVLEHEGSSVTVNKEGITFIGPCIRMNSACSAVSPSPDSKVLQVGDVCLSLGASGIDITGEKIHLPFAGSLPRAE
jgi:hypothetical protein